MATFKGFSLIQKHAHFLWLWNKRF